jgi:manganese-dependent ADP-ribose/CDP-alcohol diphosphatase
MILMLDCIILGIPGKSYPLHAVFYCGNARIIFEISIFIPLHFYRSMCQRFIAMRILVLLTVLFLTGVWSSLSAQSGFSLRLLSPGTYLVHESVDELQLSAYTLECWLNLNDTSLAVQADTTDSWIIPVIARGFRENSPGAGMNYLLGIRLEDHVLYTVFEEMVPPGFPRRYFSLAGYTPLQKNTWNHAAVSFDGTYLALYLNGNLESRIEADFKPFPASGNSLSIGTALDIGGTEHGHCSAGVDRIRLWNYARSQAELQQWLDNEITESQPGLIIGVNCEEGNGNILHAQGSLAILTVKGDDYEWQPDSLPSILLPPACAFQPLFKIGLISDPQYCDCDPSGTRYYRESLWKLGAAIDTFNTHSVNFVLSLGDLIDRNTVSLDSVLLRYEKLEMPDYKLPGNHEFFSFPDSIKPAIIGKLGMPGYYYDFHYNNWHFLVLDAMELSAYTHILHPELSDEADSLWEKIQGQVNAYTYNGGIGRKQLEWIRQKLTESKKRSESVILFCHHPVFPYNNDFNLWNDTAVVDLITQFPNVVAFINGHNHLGSYAFNQGIQFFTHRAMVETPTFNSFSVLSVYPDRIEIDGQGLNRDRTWLYNQTDTFSRFIRITNKTIHTRDTSGTFLGKVSLQSGDTIFEKASFQLKDEEGSNRFFALSGDSLFINTNENLSGVGRLKIHIGAMNCLKKMFFDSLDLVFDSLTILLTGPLPDTVVDVNQKSMSLPLDKVFTDLTRHGFAFSSQSLDPEKATVFTDEGQLICWPHQLGETAVTVTAHDTFTGYRITDTLQLRIQRIFNKPPYAKGRIDSLVLQLKKDTLQFMPDTLFSDPDGDSLSFSAHAATPEIITVVVSGEKIALIPLQPGATDIALTASDNYGGSGQLSFHASVWKEDPVGMQGNAPDETGWHYDPSLQALVIVSPEEKKSVQITLTDVSGKYSGLLFYGNLSAGNTYFPLAKDDYPPGVYVLNMMEGQQNMRCGKILIAP